MSTSDETHKVENWSEYNDALVDRGRLTVWISEEAIQDWKADREPQQGAQWIFTDRAIGTCLQIRVAHGLELRETEGFVESTATRGNNRSDAHGQHLPWAASQVEPLLEETLPEGSEAEDSEAEGSGTALGRVGADGAYDTFDVYDVISDHGATPVIPPQKNAKIKKHGNSSGPPLPRDEAIR